MKFPSKSDLSARNAALEKETHAQSIAIRALLRGEVVWSGRKPYRVGVCYPAASHGGVAIEEVDGLPSIHFWESWQRDALAHIAACITGANTEHNRELAQRRTTIEQAIKSVVSA